MAAIAPELSKDVATYLKQIDLDIPPTKNKSNNSCEAVYFRMVPTVAATTMLTKFQNDIKTAENRTVARFHQMVGEVTIRFNQYATIKGQNSNYLMPGQELEITAGVGAFSKSALPVITIGGSNVPIGEDGAARTKLAAGGIGTRSVPVVIKYKDQGGKDQTITENIEYTVGQANASIALDKMNVLYLGVENPMTITAGVGSEKVSATLDGPGSITKVGGPKWVVKPAGNPRTSAINVIIDGKKTAVVYRIKTLPPPASFVGAKRSGPMPAADFKAMGGVIARLLDSEFEAPYKVLSYQVGALGGKYPVYQIANNEGNRWSGNAKNIIDGATPGTAIFFDQIKVVGPDGRTVDLPMMSFNLK
jgi:gliding motility-associated protein GldM